MEEEEDEFTEGEDIECLEEPELEDAEGMDDNDEADPDWHCQLKENGGDHIDADDEEKESVSVNNIRQVVGFLQVVGFVLEKLKSQVSIASTKFLQLLS